MNVEGPFFGKRVDINRTREKNKKYGNTRGTNETV